MIVRLPGTSNSNVNGWTSEPKPCMSKMKKKVNIFNIKSDRRVNPSKEWRAKIFDRETFILDRVKNYCDQPN